MTAGRERFRSLDATRIDWAAAAALLALGEIVIWTSAAHRDRAVAAVAFIVPCAAVAGRRRWLPEILAGGLVVLVVKHIVWGTPVRGSAGGVGLIAVTLIFYAVGAFYSGRRALLAAALGVTAISLATLGSGSVFVNLMFLLGIDVVPPWLLGRMAREHASRERAGRERSERLDAQREMAVRAATLAERARLAREIHDVIAHSVSVMVIQAAGARTVMDRETDAAEESLRAVERAGREALAELRRLLGVLGDGRSLRELAPQPGLDDIAELVARTNATGLATSMRIEGTPVAVSSGLSLCAYRVVQEALTNTIKHATASTAQVTFWWDDGALTIDVSDDGRGAPNGTVDQTPSGHGIVGMRERVALHGGAVEVGPASDGGFAVRACFPLAKDDAA